MTIVALALGYSKTWTPTEARQRAAATTTSPAKQPRSFRETASVAHH
jgi:hypothetical protein